MSSLSLKPLLFRDNSEWLRYVLLGCAIGMGVLAFNSFVGAHDIGKMIGATLSALLLAFGGYVLQVRRLEVDPTHREVTVISKSLNMSVTDRFRFDEIIKLRLMMTYMNDSESGAQSHERWSVLFVLGNRVIPLSINLYSSKEHALRDAKRVQQVIPVEISDNPDEGWDHLTQTGKTIDAVIALRRQEPGMTLTQAKEKVDHATNRRKAPS